MRLKPAVVALLIALSAGCGTSASPGYSLDAGRDDSGNITLATGDAAGARGLDATIERGQVAVRLITLSCAGDCATVQAVGTGGYPPYTYAWENGSTNPVRQVCPASDTAYSVKVTDAGGSDENLRPPQTAGASVTADVLACPDGGPGDAAAAVPSTDGCVGGFVNPSIDGTPQTAVGGAWDAPGWTQCPNGLGPAYLANATANPGNGVTYPAPSSGPTYAVFAVQGSSSPQGSDDGFGQTLCAPLEAGASFRLDSRWIAGSPEAAGSLVQLQILEGPTVCPGVTEALSGSSWLVPITQTWNTYCVTIDAMQGPVASITFTAYVNNVDGTVDPNATALILVDDIVPVSSCP